MAKYTEFWKTLLSEVHSELKQNEHNERTFTKNELLQVEGNIPGTGYLEVFGFAISAYTVSEFFNDLKSVIEAYKPFKKKLAGLFRVEVNPDYSISLSYQPFSYEMLMNRYRDYQDRTQMEGELYKWHLVKKFQQLWSKYENNEITFQEFVEKIDFYNLVYPQFIPTFKGVAMEKPKALEEALKQLYDTGVSLKIRIGAFILRFEQLFNEINKKEGYTANISEREIATLLAYRYPEKYSFYLDSFYSPLVKSIGEKPKAKGEKLIDFYNRVEQFRKDILPEYEDIIAVKNSLTRGDAYYQDENHLILIQNIFFTMFYKKSEIKVEDTKIPEKMERKYWIYAPGEQASEWEEFYKDGVMGLGWDQLGDISQYKSREAIKHKLQELEGTDGSKVNDSLANYEFINSMSIGDYIFARKGRRKILGLGIVDSDFYYDEKAASFKNRRRVNWIKKGEWQIDHKMILKTLTDITSYPTNNGEYNFYYESLLAQIGEYIEKKSQDVSTDPINRILYGPPGTGKTYKLKNKYFPKYTDRETSISAEKNFELVASELSWWQAVALALLETGEAKVAEIKENRWVQNKLKLSDTKSVTATLWGTLQYHTIEESKTVKYSRRLEPLIFDKSENSKWQIFNDKLLEVAPEILEIKESVDNFKPNPARLIKRYVFTTFHQSYTYEDFIEGIKPKLQGEDDVEGDLGFELVDGIFKRLCSRASIDPNNRYAIFIDEINRGNIANIFGELITLIEKDKRGAKSEYEVELPYSKNRFHVPKNVDIIGTMNTADRSVEALDTALRRRFTFEEMMPETDIVKEELGDFDKWNGILISDVLQRINQRLERLIDRDHTIGHSYFLDLKNSAHFEGTLKTIFTDKIIPLLQEYFFNDYFKIAMVLGNGFLVEDEGEKVTFAKTRYTPEEDYNEKLLYKILSYDEIDIKEAILELMNVSGNEKPQA